MLQHCRDALQAHTGIHRWLGQRVQRTLVVTVELHEHQIPDFDITVAVGLRRTRWAARDFGTMVEKNLAARTAGTGVGHLPEVIRAAAGFVADAHDALYRHADLPGPDIVGFVVGLIHRHPQFVLRQTVDAGEQLPGKVDRVLLEVIAEAEVAQHLEKRVVPRGVANVFQIVMLAARTHATLRSRRTHVVALVLAEKHILELHHARVGEQQRRVVARHQGRRGDLGMLLAGKVVQKLCAYLVTFHCKSLQLRATERAGF